jgi:hypothetical protein
MVADSHHIYRHFWGQTLASGAFPNWDSPHCGRTAEREISEGTARSNLFVFGLFARQVKDHESVFVVFAPRPGFRDVVRVVELDNEVMLMSR